MTETYGETPSVPQAHHAALVISGMVRCDQMGIYDALGYMLRTHGEIFAPPKAGTGDAVDSFATLCHLRSRYLEARSLEARYGRGALLNLDHRDIATLAANSRLLAPDAMVVARAFRDANATFYARWREDAATMPSASPNGPATWIPLGS